VLENEYELCNFQQVTAALRDPVVCWLRDGKGHPVADLSGYLKVNVTELTWLFAYRSMDGHGVRTRQEATVEETVRIGREAALAAVFASLKEQGLCELSGKGRGQKVRLLRPLGPELESRVAAMDAAADAAARAALDWLGDGQRRPYRELDDRLSAALPGEWDPMTKNMLCGSAYQSVRRDRRFRTDGPCCDEVVWLEVPGPKCRATGGGGEGAGSGAAAPGGAAPPPGAPEAVESAAGPPTLVSPDLPHHELAGLFPPPTEAEYAQLRDDIQAHGQRVPAWTCQGQLLEGRSRARACQELGLPLLAREWAGPGSLIAFVVSLNLLRRHLTAGQRATVGAKLKPLFEAEARQRMLAGKAADPMANLPQGPAREQAARAVHVSPRTIDAAAKVLEHGSPGLVRAVEAGQASVAAAAELAGLPAAEQEEAVARGPKEVKGLAGRQRRRKAEKRQARRGGREVAGRGEAEGPTPDAGLAGSGRQSARGAAEPGDGAGGAGRQGPDGWTQLVQTLDTVDGLLDEVGALAPQLSGEERAGLGDRLRQLRAKVDRMARAVAKGGATRRPPPASSRAVPWGLC
jgi:hypothetical protein